MIHLAFGAAAETEDLLPESFKQIKNFGDGFVLGGRVHTQTISVYMDMEPAGSGIVTAIAERERYPGNPARERLFRAPPMCRDA